MSGFAAIIRFDGGEVAPGRIEAMTGAMEYRGPDGITSWSSGSVALGHCMMRTTPESLEETQPLANEDGSLVLVWDGYLTNWEELRRNLLDRGARLRTRSDAELVLRSYETWGDDCARHIDGEYAFVIWDALRREVFCAKDHHGQRPLFYHWDGKTAVIASDIAAVLAALPEQPAINHGFMAEVISHRWFSPDETVWAGVKRLRPAHWMRIGGDGPRSAEYWTLPVEVSITYRREQDYFDHYRHILEESVRQASRTHRPLAFEVSGGLDSSSLFTMADKLLGAGRLAAPDIRGYTLAGPIGTAADEVAYARSVGRHLGRAITEVPLFMPGLAWFTQRAAADRDMPPYPNAAMGINLYHAMVHDGCRVSLNGLGGDQWLDGNLSYYREQIRSGDFRGFATSFRADVAHMGWNRAGRLMLRRSVEGILPDQVVSAIHKARKIGKPDDLDTLDWLTDEFRQELGKRCARFESTIPRMRKWRHKNLKLRFPYIVINHDALTRQQARDGVEPRSPMFSRAFIEFSAATPENLRLRGGVKKYIHRQALVGMLPEDVINRRSKAEFSAAVIANNADLKEFFQNRLPDSAGTAMDRAGVARVFASYCNATIDELSTWEVWGIYAYAILIRSRINNLPEKAAR